MSGPLEVVLVGCSGSKRDHAAPARELYTSPLFLKARRYAEIKGGPWAILSALHGLVMPDQVLEPYDFTFKHMKSASRSPSAAMETWGRKVQDALLARWPDARFALLAGQDYAACLKGYQTVRIGGRVYEYMNPPDSLEPFAGMGIGKRLAWLDGQIHALLAEGRRNAEAAEKALDPANEPDTETRECDFCGQEAVCAVSEQGHATPARPELASICGPCATWALDQLRRRTG